MIDFKNKEPLVLIFLKIFKIKNLWFLLFQKPKRTNDFHERTQIFMEGYLINSLILWKLWYYIYIMGNTSPVHSESTQQSHQSTIHWKPIMAL
jgi:hypothetical protein